MNESVKDDIEIYEIGLERQVIKKREEALHERELEIWSHRQNTAEIVADEILLKTDIEPSEVNYVLGHSAGFINGLRKAIDTIVSELSKQYRDIPISEDELYMIVELGAIKEEAWLKDYKQKLTIEKQGWKYDFTRRCPIWVKEKNDDAKM